MKTMLFLTWGFILLTPAFSQTETAAIKAAEAKNHIGETATVIGKVASTRFLSSATGQPTFINLEKPFPEQLFVIMIDHNMRTKFEVAPEELFKGKTVKVTGKIEDFKGVPQIVVRDPNQIAIAEEK